MIIMGVDPGVALLGYAIIKKIPSQNRDRKPEVIDFGCITTKPIDSAGERLHIIYKEINKLINRYHPVLLSVESLYFFKNAKTAMPVSQAKGVILLSAAQKSIPVVEFSPLQVKMAVVGYGKAEKKQVQLMLKELLDFGKLDLKKNHRKKDDATDALGVALCATLKNFR